jgi:uncharacterized protein YjbI with pentapeptide repeats
MPSDTHISQEEINILVAEHGRYLKNMRGARRLNLSMRQAGNLDLSRHLLRDAEMVGTVFDGGRLMRTDLTMANLFGASLIGCDMRQCNLAKADLRGAKLRSANLSEAILDQADLREGVILAKDKNGNLRDAHAPDGRARMDETVFSKISAKGARFSHAISVGTDLSNANFAGARVSEHSAA